MIGIVHEFEWPVAQASLTGCGDASTQLPTAVHAGKGACQPTDSTPPVTDPAGTEHVLQLLESIQQSIAQIHSREQQLIQRWYIEAIELGMTVARAIIASSVNTSSDRILDVIQSAQLNVFEDNQPLTIRANPLDLNRLLQMEPADRPFSQETVLRPDDKIQPGDCQISNGELTVASDLSLQLEEVHHRLVEEFSNG